jgi:hypothetical protein
MVASHSALKKENEQLTDQLNTMNSELKRLAEVNSSVNKEMLMLMSEMSNQKKDHIQQLVATSELYRLRSENVALSFHNTQLLETNASLKIQLRCLQSLSQINTK